MARAAAAALPLTAHQRSELVQLTRLPSTPQSIVLRAKIVLGAADGVANKTLAARLVTTRMTVLLWRNRYAEEGLVGILEDRPRPGRPKEISPEQEAQIVEATRSTKPNHATHWTVRTLARGQGVSPASVYRIWRAYGLQPHRVETFKFSNDPQFVHKVRDIVGLYMNPPDKALVLSVDEKSQIQALDRTAPLLPLRPGCPERQTHDYRRYGTTTLFAAFNILTGKVIGTCQDRHRGREFVKFLRQLEQEVPPELEIHLIVDNYGTHKHPEVKTWLAKRPRYHLHFTPTSSSWLNQVEIWFHILSKDVVRDGVWRSKRDLVRQIMSYIENYTKQRARPFRWTYTGKPLVA